MTLSNSTRNEEKSDNFDFDINFTIELFEMHPYML